MKEQDITALAREYAESKIKEKGLNHKDHMMFEAITSNAENCLAWLLRRYYLVEKSKLIEKYKSTTATVGKPNFCNTIRISEIEEANKALLESLFPEIEKEVERNDKEK